MSDVADPTRQADLDPKLRKIIEDTADPRKKPYYCATCSAVITTADNRIEVGNSHDHRFTNPAGYHFHVGCFDEALGCAIVGGATDADTWFTGYRWRIANCDQCGSQLGWFFDSGEHHFFGLILDRLQTDA